MKSLEEEYVKGTKRKENTIRPAEVTSRILQTGVSKTVTAFILVTAMSMCKQDEVILFFFLLNQHAECLAVFLLLKQEDDKQKKNTG
jgi:hypothetical protein